MVLAMASAMLTAAAAPAATTDVPAGLPAALTPPPPAPFPWAADTGQLPAAMPAPAAPGAGRGAAPAGPAALAAGTQTPAPPVNGALPEIGDVLAIVEKATGAQAAEGTSDYSAPVKLAIVFTGLAVLPAALMMMTSFTRIIIVLSFIRRALTTQNIPPTIAVVGLALFLTLFTMAPTFTRVNADAVQPYLAGQIDFQVAANRGVADLKEFMVRQTRRTDLAFFVDLAKVPAPKTATDLPAYVAIPAFAVSEFRTSFEMGCLLFIPFLLIDLVVSGILLSAGMMMLPPAIISLPLKIILFVLVDGWRLLAQSLVTSFN
jgi:flagellar biosynthetic protein FliP